MAKESEDAYRLHLPSSKHWTMFPMKGMQAVAVAMSESTITPEQMERQVFGTPRREQQEP